MEHFNCSFPFPKMNSFVFCSNSQTRSFVTSCYVPKCIILTWSCFVPTWIVRSWCCRVWCITLLCLRTTYYLANCWMVSYLLNSIFKLKWQTISNVYSIIPEAWNIQACKLGFLSQDPVSFWDGIFILGFLSNPRK